MTWWSQALPRLIGKDMHGSLLAHRRVAVLAHPNNMGRDVEGEILESFESWPKDDPWKMIVIGKG